MCCQGQAIHHPRPRVSSNCARRSMDLPGPATAASSIPRGNELVVRTMEGRERSVFVSDPDSPPAMPDVCRDDGSIVFIWPFRNGTNAIGMCGGSTRTDRGPADHGRSACDRTGLRTRWALGSVSCGDADPQHPPQWGKAVVLIPTPALSNIAFSPDGKWVAPSRAACAGRETGTQAGTHLAGRVGSKAAGRRRRRNTPFYAGRIGHCLGAAREGRGKHPDPAIGRLPRRVYHRLCSGGRITGFRWSPDGSQLAVQRQRRDSDVVLLRDGDEDR